MFIVSLPYAVLHGGWWAVFALVGVSYICYYTGVILVECLYDDEGRRIRGSYVQIAEAVWGPRIGGRMVNIAQLIELLMTCILYVVLCGDLLEGSFPQAAMDKMGWMMLSCILLLSCAFLTNLTAVSRLSFWNTISHLVINAVVVFYCFSWIASWHWTWVRWTTNIQTFPTVLGIVVFSYTSQIFLPTLEGCMVDRSKFVPMLKWTHVAAAAFKASFGLIGFLTFGPNTQQEVTSNLPTQEFKAIINLILVVKALLSYPLPFYAAEQLLEVTFCQGKPVTFFEGCFHTDGKLKILALFSRICLVFFTLFMAVSVPYFALLMGLIGACTGTMLSFIWPCVFHLKLKGSSMGRRARIWEYCIIAMGVSFCFIGVIFSALELSRAMNASDEYY